MSLRAPRAALQVALALVATTTRAGAAPTVLAAVDSGAVSSWSAAIAESDTVVFFAADGGLLRAPFHLGTRETLWAATPEARVVRARVSPDGREVAWITRRAARDTTTLWATHDGVPRPLVGYVPLRPERFGVVHAEAGMPTVEDDDARGGRLIQPNVGMRQLAASPFDWTPDGRAVVFGDAQGLAAATIDSGVVFPVSRALVQSLTLLQPAPLYLAEAVVLGEALRGLGRLGEAGGAGAGAGVAGNEEAQRQVRAERGAYLIYPLPHRWRFYRPGTLDPSRRRAAGPSGVWWANGRHVMSVRSDDPRERKVADAEASVLWLGDDATRRELVWAAGRSLMARPEDGGPSHVLLRTRTALHTAFATPDGTHIGLVGDSLWVWDVAAGTAEAFALAGLDPTQLNVAPGGEVVVVSAAARKAPVVASADREHHTLVAETTPEHRHGVVTPSPGGRYLVLCDPGPTAPTRLDVWDVARRRWLSVENPGVIGWEPLTPR